jgi:glycogen debranching enzyme
MTRLRRQAVFLFVVLQVGWLPFAMAQQSTTATDAPLELVRAARPWEFVSAVGTRSGLLGSESGQFEAWVYPLKILRDFHLRFKVDGEVIDGKSLVRSVSVRPEATTITYVWDTFSVRETLFAPVHEAGAIIALDVEAAQPIEIDAVFEKDFRLEWPAAMGGSDIDWVPALHAFSLSDDEHKFSALVGSPSATQFQAEDVTNYTRTLENSFGFGVIPTGKTSKLIVIAGSFAGLPSAETTYKKLSSNYPELLADSEAYYQNYLKQHVSVVLPDKPLQQAYEWAQVSVLQGLVENPYLGTSLIAGYKESGDDARPGFAWFFGRDALWTALALDAEGDFATTKSALQFLSKYQRSDGKVPHEISQTASFVPWFQSLPYAYSSADATPLFIIAMQNYVQRSGDTALAKDKWDNLWRAYQFMVATYDAAGIPRNEGVGHGWVEGGPLYGVKSELYQAGVVLEAVRDLGLLAQALGKKDEATSLQADFEKGKPRLNKAFWIEDKQRYAYALDARGTKLDTPSVLAAVPMWFGLLDEEKARPMLGEIEKPGMQADWGMRIISNHDPKYEAAGYHSGTVWPLFTGWASVAEYRYHHATSAYANLRANALLTFDGSLGNVTEVLSGNYYQTLATGSPHQIWSSAMVISPLLTGLLGLDTNASLNQVTLRPHIPADWDFFALNNIQAGECRVNIQYRKLADRINFEITNRTDKNCTIELSPALSLRAQVTSVEANGRSIPYHVQENVEDQHVNLQVHVAERPAHVEIRVKNDFGWSEEPTLPPLGSTSHGLRIVKEQWSENRDTLTLDAASAVAGTYLLDVWNPSQIAKVDGAELLRGEVRDARLRIITTAPDPGSDAAQEVIIHFMGGSRPKKVGDSSDTNTKGTE